jgi:surfactin synthase thioesterase subunit
MQNPTTSLEDEVTATKQALARIDGPVVLAGHSWGGFVITQTSPARLLLTLFLSCRQSCVLIIVGQSSPGGVVKL